VGIAPQQCARQYAGMRMARAQGTKKDTQNPQHELYSRNV
jgi:hypothetical protein